MIHASPIVNIFRAVKAHTYANFMFLKDGDPVFRCESAVGLNCHVIDRLAHYGSYHCRKAVENGRRHKHWLATMKYQANLVARSGCTIRVHSM